MAVIISMTTLASRHDLILETLASLKRQTVQPDAIYIYGCQGAKAPAFEYDLVTFHTMLHDPGPVMKIGAVHEGGLAKDDIVVTVDDDIVYRPEWLETLLAGARANPDAAVGLAGWFAPYLIKHRSFHFTNKPCSTDVLEGWAGVAYRVKFFREMEYVENRRIPSPTHILYPPDLFRCVDDVWISGYLAARGVPRLVLGTPLSKECKPGHPGLHHRPDFKSHNVVAAQWWHEHGVWGPS